MLRLSGFHCRHTEWDGIPLGAAGWEERRLHCLREDEFANYYGSACLGWVVARAQRGAHYWGWPAQLFKCLHSEEDAECVIGRFEKDRALLQKLESQHGLTSREKSIAERHLLKRRSLKMMCWAFDGSDAKLTADIRQHLQDRARLLRVTQIVEDANGIAANHTNKEACRKFRKPMVS